MQEQYCLYHQNQSITHFCRAYCCSMPLCLDCMNDHYQYHFTQKEPPKIEKLSTTYQDILKVIRGLYAMYGDNYSQLKSFYQKRASESRLSQQLAECKIKVLRIIDDYFEQQERQLNLIQDNEQNFLEEQLITIEKFIMEKNTEVEAIARKVDGPKGIKHVINLLTSDFVSQSKQDSNKCTQFLSQLNYLTPEVVFDIGQFHILQADLSKLLVIKNSKFFESQVNFNNDNLRDQHPLSQIAQSNALYKLSLNQPNVKFTTPVPIPKEYSSNSFEAQNEQQLQQNEQHIIDNGGYEQNYEDIPSIPENSSTPQQKHMKQQLPNESSYFSFPENQPSFQNKDVSSHSFKVIFPPDKIQEAHQRQASSQISSIYDQIQSNQRTNYVLFPNSGARQNSFNF